MNETVAPAPADDPRRLPLDVIDMDDRLRPVDAEKMAELRASMAEQGQLTPIEVAPKEGGRWELVFGAHRLTAARDLALPDIAVQVFRGSADERRLREIDENLYRHELNPLDQAVFLAERRAIYERLHPETKHGRNQHTGGVAKLATPRPRTFAEDVAARIGLSYRTVARALQRAETLHPDAIVALRGSALARKGAVLDALRDVPQAKQAAVVRLLLSEAEDRPRTVAEARRVVLKERAAPPPDPLERLKGSIRKLAAADRLALYEWLTEDPDFGLGKGRGRRP